MIREHEPADAVVRMDVWRAASESDLDRGWTPRNEVGELSLADAEERLVDLIECGIPVSAKIRQRTGSATHICRIDIALNDV